MILWCTKHISFHCEGAEKCIFQALFTITNWNHVLKAFDCKRSTLWAWKQYLWYSTTISWLMVYVYFWKKVSAKEDWCTDKANIKPGQLNFCQLWVLTERILADVAKCEFSPLCSECTTYRFLVENLYIWTHCWKMLSKRVYPGLTWKGKICWLCPTYTQSGSSGLHRAFIQKQNVFTITGHWPVFNSRELAMMCEEMRYYVLS